MTIEIGKANIFFSVLVAHPRKHYVNKMTSILIQRLWDTKETNRWKIGEKAIFSLVKSTDHHEELTYAY